MKRYLPPAIVASMMAAISYFKSTHCRSNSFASPDSYTHLCYSDIPALFGARGLDQGINPYADPSTSMEYPVGTGYIASWTARVVDDFISYFDLNALLIALLFVATTMAISSMAPRIWPLFALAPAMVSSLYINWDIWGVAAMVIGFYYLSKERFDLAGIWIGLSIVIKFFPIIFLPAIVLYFYLRLKYLRLKTDWRPFFFYLVATLLISNFSTAVIHFEGWLRFFTFNQDRGVDLGSIWYALTLLFNISYPSLNLTIALAAIVIVAVSYPRLRAFRVNAIDPYQLLLLTSFLLLSLFFSVNKVYSPQYVIWLTPLALLLMATSQRDLGKERAWFWIWQTGEAIYHLGIWQYLAEYSGGQGLSEPLYALTIIIRIATLTGFALTVARARLPLPLKEAVTD